MSERLGVLVTRAPIARSSHGVACSILIPTYMENENISSLADLLKGYVPELNCEIVFIDDNSPDGTAEIIGKLSKIYDNWRLLVRSGKMGLGSAYKDGFKISTGDLIAQMDADLSHNPKELQSLIDGLRNADVVIGSRNTLGGKVDGWKWYRKVINKGANILADIFLGLKIRDATSGFRVYKRKAFEQIALKSTVNGFEFQVEALHIAKKLRFRIAEVPITFTNRKNGKSKLSFKDVFMYVKSLIEMRLREFSSET